MTAPGQVASHAKDEAADVASTAGDKAAEVKDAAVGQAGQVAGTAKEQLSDVVGETLSQAKDLTAQVKDQASEQLTAQSERLTTGMRQLGDQLSNGDTSGIVGQVLTEAGQRLQSLTDYVDQVGTDGLLRDVRSYARRNPGTFLLGAALAGLVSGRVMKGITSKKDTETSTAALGGTPVPPLGTPGGTAAGDPLVGISETGLGARAGYTASPYPDSSYEATSVQPVYGGGS